LVLDGQQRMTTLQLLLCALCDRLEALGEREAATNYREYCCQGRWIPTMYDRPDFYRCLSERNPTGDSSVVHAKRCFEELSETLDINDCEATIKSLLNRISMTTFVVQNKNSIQSVYEKMSLRARAEQTCVDLFSCIECYASGDGGRETKATHWGANGERLCKDCASTKSGVNPMTPGIPMSPVDVIRNFVFDHYDGDAAMTEGFEKYWGPIETSGGVNSGLDTEKFEASLSQFLDVSGFHVHNRWGIISAFERWWGQPGENGPEAHAETKLNELLNGMLQSESLLATTAS